MPSPSKGASALSSNLRSILLYYTDGVVSQVLDLDETLVHSTLDFGEPKTDFTFEVALNNRKHCVNVRQRPHMAAFLQRCSKLFELVIFTASQKLYAEQLLNIIDPGRWGPP